VHALHATNSWPPAVRDRTSTFCKSARRTLRAGMGGGRSGASEADLAAVRATLAARGGAAVPPNFEQTAPGPSGRPGRMPQRAQRSPQTEAFLQLLGLPYNLDGPDPGRGPPAAARTAPAGAQPLHGCAAFMAARAELCGLLVPRDRQV
jgi:hypothetical protein